LIPAAALCAVSPGSAQRLRCDATVAFRLLNSAFAARFGRRLTVSDAYRSLAEQQQLHAVKPALAAVPGTSNHGWGLAADLAGGVEHFGTAEHQWMAANAPRFGWQHPEWARQGGSRPEPWHFEFGRIS
jgi:LAS superfamily LD-carboxypeptidase LdcB